MRIADVDGQVLIGVEKLSTVIDDNEFVLSANISNS